MFKGFTKLRLRFAWCWSGRRVMHGIDNVNLWEKKLWNILWCYIDIMAASSGAVTAIHVARNCSLSFQSMCTSCERHGGCSHAQQRDLLTWYGLPCSLLLWRRGRAGEGGNKRPKHHHQVNQTTKLNYYKMMWLSLSFVLINQSSREFRPWLHHLHRVTHICVNVAPLLLVCVWRRVGPRLTTCRYWRDKKWQGRSL